MNPKDYLVNFMNEEEKKLDPYLNEDAAFHRLVADYKKRNKLVVALDFDGVIFDCHKDGFEFPQVIELIKKCNELGFLIVIFSASHRERYPLIEERCKEIGIKIDCINTNVVHFFRDTTGEDRTGSKIYYNILLDDRAGLPSAFRVLKRLVDYILYEKKHIL